ncbi:short chain dehydrogenase [Mucilaginibacter lappiensis]|uniref:NAD(P)-dependent dehydrogenase (Short-subunit alcohol dehydrogenase family) n=1 Tax=Mucilaginibacter lappiensis TaxID=354630 RepID=A0A841JDN6_9SPHI|nr:short chain dehydrogenase [Mucilaginibacter lappiensis]MBB6126585.1 NAD(P)-dependent dehydrogenase (short-subunit alcohol dehydrogenase family) [Mucilaginibacter lappiensis]
MKIIIVGASGTIGKKVTEALRGENEIITAGSKSGDIQVDISSTESIEAFYKQTGNFDALISVTGNAYFGPLKTMTIKDFDIGIQSKVRGQVNLVLIGQHYINAKGSFTLTSGILSDDPILLGVNPAAVNGAINAFTKSAAIELENGVRINAISAGVVEDAPGYFSYFPGHIPVTMDRVTNAYYKSVFGALTGQVIQVW